MNDRSGTAFLKSIDTSNISHSGENMFELLDSPFDKIEEDHVVQVVTDAASSYVSTGENNGKKEKTFLVSNVLHIILI